MDKIKDLFKKWKKAHKTDNNWENNFPLNKSSEDIPDEKFKESFVEDGKFDDCAEEIKILFIARESNVSTDNKIINYPICGEFWMKQVVKVKDKNEKDYYSKDDKRTQTTYYNYLKKIKACLNKTQVEKITDLNDCAYMNLNKRGGYNQCYNEKGRYTRLEAYINNYSEFIKEEIEILNPQKIVFLGFNKGYGDIVMKLIKKDIPCYAVHHPSSTRKYKDLEEKLSKGDCM